MTKVKADNKGRLTGAKALKSYEKRTQPDGTITYTPTVPEQFDGVRDVTVSDFEAFFGVSPEWVPAEDAIDTQRISEPGFLPTGLVLTRFVEGEAGQRMHTGTEFKREHVLIRIKKDVID